MKSVLLGVGCLLAGALVALGYSHYLGEGKQLADLQIELSDKATEVAAVQKEKQAAKNETEAMSAQIEKLTATKTDLQKQVDDLKSAAVTTSTPAPAPTTPVFPASMAGMVKAQIASRNEEKFQRLVKRLNLTPEQQTALKAAMDAEDKRTEELTSKFFAGGKIDPAAAAAVANGTKSVDQTLNDLLTPDQKTTYTQMKNDEKANNAEAMASLQMNQMATSLNLTDAQKDQVGSVLYQNQMNMQDPAWIKANLTTNPSDPLAVLEAQEKAKEDALAKVLTTDQMTTYRQQAQSQLAMQKAMIQKFMPTAPSAAPAPAPVSP